MAHHISHRASKSKPPQPATHNFVDPDETPADFDLAAFPILAEHWFGIVANVRSRRNLERVHGNGVRLVGELLDELAREYGLGTVIDRKLEIYASLSDDALDATGGRHFPPPPLTEVR